MAKKKTTRKPDDGDVVEAETVEAEADAVQEAEVLAGELVPVDDGEPTGAALMRIIDKAVEQGQGIEVIERLLVVHERIEANQARKAYNAAMSALRAELPEIVKTEEVDYPSKKAGGRVQYMHENLARMVEDLSPPMAKHGLSFRWRTDASNAQLIQVTCVVTHAAGHAEETTLFGPPDDTGNKNALQAIASTVSYLQRYTLKAAIGVAAGKDDDGAGGAKVDPRKRGDGQEPIQQPTASNNGSAAAVAPGEGATVDELYQARALFPTDDKTVTANQQGRLYNLARKAGWTNASVDEVLARELSLRLSEIPSTGDAYEAIVRWFQAHQPASSGGS